MKRGASKRLAQANLAPVTIEAPQQRQATGRSTPRRTASRPRASTRRVAAPSPQQQPVQPSLPANAGVQRGTGPVPGYVANESVAGTKTATPIIEIPQSLSVIGAEQIRDQKLVSKFDDTLRYTPGVIAATFGTDFRDDWFLIRGFDAQQDSLFLDGMALTYFAFAGFKLQPFNLERVEVLRGPSAVMYGGSSPGGLVNAVSKLPPVEPIRYLEAGVNNFGNAYSQFDFGGPVATQPGNGKMLYRIVGQVQGGGTQTDYVNNDNYFIAPSVTWLPDVDTRLTVFAMASHNQTRAPNFLPYVGTVTAAPFGRIPTDLFTGDPSADRYGRTQEMVSYQFEKHLSDNATFRQNGRAAHVEVKYTGLFGQGYATTPAAADIMRGNFLAASKATQLNLDNQFEYRFATGPFQHTTLIGLDLNITRDFKVVASYTNYDLFVSKGSRSDIDRYGSHRQAAPGRFVLDGLHVPG